MTGQCLCAGCNDCDTSRTSAPNAQCSRRTDYLVNPLCAFCRGSAAVAIGRVLGIVLGIVLVLAVLAFVLGLHVWFVRWAVSL